MFKYHSSVCKILAHTIKVSFFLHYQCLLSIFLLPTSFAISFTLPSLLKQLPGLQDWNIYIFQGEKLSSVVSLHGEISLPLMMSRGSSQNHQNCIELLWHNFCAFCISICHYNAYTRVPELMFHCFDTGFIIGPFIIVSNVILLCCF